MRPKKAGKASSTCSRREQDGDEKPRPALLQQPRDVPDAGGELTARLIQEARVLARLEHNAEWEPLLEELYGAFSQPEVWKVYPETLVTILIALLLVFFVFIGLLAVLSFFRNSMDP